MIYLDCVMSLLATLAATSTLTFKVFSDVSRQLLDGLASHFVQTFGELMG